MKRLLREPLAVAGLLCLLPLLAAALLAPGAELAEAVVAVPFARPGGALPLGADLAGRDVLARLLRGAPATLAGGAAAAVLAAFTALPLGMAAAWRGGRPAAALPPLATAAEALPPALLALGLGLLLPPGSTTAVVAVALALWPGLLRAGAAEAARLRQAPFIAALMVVGAGPARLLLLHALPNAGPAVGAMLLRALAQAVPACALLGFLGLGAPAPGWGAMVAEAAVALPEGWWAVAAPGLGVMLASLGATLLAEALRR